ncbi:MAG: SulP family inorganic anion transporter [Hyphomicrobiales bacterium]
MRVSLPVFTWLPLVNRKSLVADFWAGLTGAIVVLPQGVAFATIAGMPPEYGLYAAIVPTIIAALFGSSWHLVAGPSTTASLVLFSALSMHAVPGSADYVALALTLACMVGLMELGLGIFRLGAVVNFISHSVIVGFTAGVGILIILTQVRNFIGITVPKGLHTYELVPYLATHLGELDLPTTAVGASTLAAGLLVRRFLPRVPFMIVAIVAGSLVGYGFLKEGHLIATVGVLPAHLPHLSAPSFDPKVWAMLAPTALALAVSALNESVSISRAIAIRSGQHVDANQEFIGQGLANTIGSFFSGYVVSSSFNRSSLNFTAGAKTPMSALIASLLLAGFISFAAPLAAYLPYSAMAATLFLVGWNLIDIDGIRQIARTSRVEAGILAATLGAALFVPVQFAILFGVFLSLLVYLYRTSKPRIIHFVPDPGASGRKLAEPGLDLPECPQLKILRFNGSLFFGAVNAFKETLLAFEKYDPATRHIAIVMSGVNFIDVAGAEALAEMARRFRGRNGAVYLIGANSYVMGLLKRGGYLASIGERNVFSSKTHALREIYRRLDYSVCRDCQLNVFIECRRKGRQEPADAFPEEEPV